MANAIKYTEAMTFDQVSKAIASLNKRATTLKADIQKCLISVAIRWHETGDAKQATELFTRLAKEVEGYYGQAISDYLSHYLKLEWNVADKAFRYKETKVTRETCLEMKATPFWTFSPPKEVKPYDMMAAVESMLATAVKHSKKPKATDKIDNTLLNRLLRVVGEHKAEQAMAEQEQQAAA